MRVERQGRENMGPGRWSRRRWWTTIGAILGGQVLLVMALSQKGGSATRGTAPTCLFRMAWDELPRPSELPWVEDPAQFALVSPRGFSGLLWSRLPRFEFSSAEWREPPRWLAPDPGGLGERYVPLEAPRPSFTQIVAERLDPPLVPLANPKETAPVPSSLRVEGDLATRPLATKLDLPAWTAEDLLAPTVVQVLVDAEGVVWSATLLGRSGLEAADQRALDLARAARFATFTPGPARSLLTWGRLIFLWQSLPPAATNAATNLAKP